MGEMLMIIQKERNKKRKHVSRMPHFNTNSHKSPFLQPNAFAANATLDFYSDASINSINLSKYACVCVCVRLA